MILEIQLENITKHIDTLSSFGDFIITGDYVYLDTIKDISTISQSLPIVKCQYISSSNYKFIPNDFGRKWCHEVLYKHELLVFERSEECQQRLRAINEELDKLEKGERNIAEKA